ncbi:MAG: acyl-CoA dehydrogenase [Pseudomonadota bacterium]
MTYQPPLTELQFVLQDLAGMGELAQLPGFEEATPDLVGAVLEEAGKLAGEVLAPINWSGDRAGSVYENGVVRTPEGFREAYSQFVEGGWNSLPFPPDYGGQGMPWLLATAAHEMWQAANLSFGLCPLLTIGAVDLLHTHGTDAQKETYLARLISGEWTGTMNLTEPQAGSDVGALKTKAERHSDAEHGDHYRIKGQKIFITWGEHDCAENIVHMVLARVQGAPAGSKGISLFIVPKFQVNADGGLGPRNDLRCVSIEHKLGIIASPTAVMSYGDNEGAVGYLVGEENRGMEYMFTMMNNARLMVGLQGVAIAERAYQQARAFAGDRVQSKPIAARVGTSGDGAVPIIQHPDVRRMLMTMKAKTEAARALTLVTAAALDRSRTEPDPAKKAAAQARVDLLIPITKAWSTDVGCDVASIGVQIHGGMGFIEETGAAQHYRDARILPIYEGTNGIQALDLLFRKILRDRGQASQALVEEMAADAVRLAAAQDDSLASLGKDLTGALKVLGDTTQHLAGQAAEDLNHAAAGATPYLALAGTVIGAWLLARGAEAAQSRLASGDGDPAFLKAKTTTARFYAANILPQAPAHATAVTTGADSVLELAEADF